jgi:hypothetical protein
MLKENAERMADLRAVDVVFVAAYS